MKKIIYLAVILFSIKIALGQVPSPVACYDFSGNFLEKNGGPTLLPITGTGTFSSSIGLCGTDSVYAFPQGYGLQMPIGGVFPNNHYTIELLFKFSTPPHFTACGQAYQRVIDFKNNTVDAGVYTWINNLNMYPQNFGNLNNAPNLTWLHLFITRDNTNNQLRGYIGNVLTISSVDGAGQATFLSNLILFKDDPVSCPNEEGAGIIDYMRIYNVPLTLAQINQVLNASNAPTVTVNGSTNICAGNTITLTASGAGNYLWNTGSSLGSIQVSPTVTTTYSVTGWNNVFCQKSCSSNPATITVNVNPAPAVVVNSATICSGQTANLTAGGAINYTWSAGAIPTGINTASVIPINTTTYSVTGSNGMCANTAIATVIVNPLPLLSIISTEKACINTPINLQGTSGYITYQWNGPNGFSSPNANASFTATSINQSGTYSLIVTNVNGCVNTATTTIVIGSPQPVPSITSTPNACINSPVSLKGNPGIFEYLWIGPNNFVSSNSDASFTALNVNQSGTYTFAVTKDGCISTATTNVVIYPIPYGNLVMSNDKVCVPTCVNFSCQSTSALQNVVWKLKDETILGSGLFINHCFNNAGAYFITATFNDMNGCINKSEPIYVEAFDTPRAEFIFSPTNILVNEEIQFTDKSRDATEWSWHFTEQKNNTSIVQNPTAVYQDAGIYPVALVIKNNKGCTDTIVKTIIIDQDFRIYIPNTFTPNGDGLNDVFQPSGHGIKKYNMQIFDRWGEKIFTSNDFSNGWDGTIKGISCKEGTYVWKINITDVNAKAKELIGTVSVMK